MQGQGRDISCRSFLWIVYFADHANTDRHRAEPCLCASTLLILIVRFLTLLFVYCFPRWLSIAYISLAQLGVEHPASSKEIGWAWAGCGDSVEAMGLDTFVRGALRNAQEDVTRQQRALPREGEEPSPTTAAGTSDELPLSYEEPQDEMLSRWLRERPELEGLMEAVSHRWGRGRAGRGGGGGESHRPCIPCPQTR